MKLTVPQQIMLKKFARTGVASTTELAGTKNWGRTLRALYNKGLVAFTGTSWCLTDKAPPIMAQLDQVE